MLRTSTAARVLTSADRDAALAVCERDPVANAFVASRLLEQRAFTSAGGEVWGYAERGELVSLCWAGANLVPVEATGAGAGRLRRAGPPDRPAVLLDPRARPTAVLGLWERLERPWWPAREVRADQPLLVLDGRPAGRRRTRWCAGPARPRPTSSYRRRRRCSRRRSASRPIGRDGGASYRASVSQLVLAGRTFVRVGPGRARAARGRVQGRPGVGDATASPRSRVSGWRPRLRGQGLAAAAMAAVCVATRAEIAPVVSLYVNAYNAPALGGLPAGRLPAGRHLRHRPVLTPAAAPADELVQGGRSGGSSAVEAGWASWPARRGPEPERARTMSSTHSGSNITCSQANRRTSQPRTTSSS